MNRNQHLNERIFVNKGTKEFEVLVLLYLKFL